MIVGVPREIKREEYRVGITPQGADHLKKHGHVVLVEENAGLGCGFGDDEYLAADADVVDRETLFAKSDLIVKVKEPLPSEYPLIREGQSLFTYLHLAANRELAELLLRKRVTALGYETLSSGGTLPLLAPMSEIAGRMAPLMGAYYLQRFRGGRGILPTGAVGVPPGRIMILGAGTVGRNAARVSMGLGMDTIVLNRGLERLRGIDELFFGRVKTLALSRQNVARILPEADIVVGALLIPGGRTPVIILREMLKSMKKGAVIVDVSIDQGGCADTSRPTSHDDPVYEVDGIIHYAVANMPGAYPRTSTIALTTATLPYISLLADKGIRKAISESPEVASAINLFGGHVAHKSLADTLGLPCSEINAIQDR